MSAATLPLAASLALPLDVVTQKLAWIGTTGSGKTYGALRLAELMWQAGLQFAAIDTMGIWYGLRLNSDGVSPGIPITIFGGQHGDLPIRPNDGALVAEVIVNEKISAVVDVSSFETDAEKARFASDFADRLYRLKTTSPSAIHLFLEEAHEFIPQNPMGNETMMLHHFNRIWKQGRNFGIGGSIITQRPQDVAKKSLELSSAVLAFNTTGSNTLDAMVKWLKDVEGVKELPKLPMGKDAQFLLYSPSWLKRSGMFRISERETFHASYDPFSAPLADADRRELKGLLELTPFSREEHRRSWEPSTDPVESARRFVVRSFQSFGAKNDTERNGWRTRTSKCVWSPCVAWNSYAAALPAFASRLRDVIIECEDWRRILEIYDATDTLFYIDPPYPHSSRTGGHRKTYGRDYELSDADHAELCRRCLALQGHVVLSSYRNPVYDEILDGWQVVTTSARAQCNRPRTEALYLSPSVTAETVGKLQLEVA